MPIPYHHVILRSRIEITADDVHQHKAIQKGFAKLTELYIIPLLARLFSKYVPQDVVIHLDKLVVDGGILPIDGQGFLRHVEQNLTVTLEKEISKVMQDTSRVVPIVEMQLQAVAHYLSKGNFAWWMKEKSERDIEHSYLTLLHRFPLRIEELWYNMENQEQSVLRSLTFFTPSTLQQTLSLLLKQPIQNFLPVLDTLEKIVAETRILTERPYSVQQQLGAQLLLRFLHKPWSHMTPLGLVNMLLQQVACTTGISYQAILTKLQTYCSNHSDMPHAFQALLGSATKVSDSQRETQAQYLWDAGMGEAPFLQEERDPYSEVVAVGPKLLSQLQDIATTPPNFHTGVIKDKEFLLKSLDQVDTMTSHQVDSMVESVQMGSWDVQGVLKGWLREAVNRKRLIQKLSNQPLVALVKVFNPMVSTLLSEFLQWSRLTVTAVNVLGNLIKALKEAALWYGITENKQERYVDKIRRLFEPHISDRLIRELPVNGLLNGLFLPMHVHTPLDTLQIAQCVAYTTPMQMPPHLSDVSQAMLQPASSLFKPMTTPFEAAFLDQLTTIMRSNWHITMSASTDWMIQVAARCREAVMAPEYYVERLLLHCAAHIPYDPIGLCNLWIATAQRHAYLRLTSLLVALRKKVAPPLSHFTQAGLAIPHGPGLWKKIPTLNESMHDGQQNRPNLEVKSASLASQNDFIEVIEFLKYNLLPNDYSHPANLVAQCLIHATSTQINHYLGSLCEDTTMLEKLLAYTPASALSKLVAAWVPVEKVLLDQLATVMHQDGKGFAEERLTRLLILVAKRSGDDMTGYIKRLLFSCAVYRQCNPTELVDQWIAVSERLRYGDLWATLCSVRYHVVTLNLNKVDPIDLTLLPLQEDLADQLGQAFVPHDYKRLLLAIKNAMGSSQWHTFTEHAVVIPWVTENLPSALLYLKEKIATCVINYVKSNLQTKSNQVIQRWQCFLHTGIVEQYPHATALLQDMFTYVPTFPIMQVMGEEVIKDRLLMHFTHAQLLSLFQRYIPWNTTYASHLQDLYTYWCGIQGTLGPQATMKHLFWEAVWQTLPHKSTATDQWMAQIVIHLSEVLEITPLMLLETFKSVPTQSLPLSALLKHCYENFSKKIGLAAVQSGKFAPLYLLLHGGMPLFHAQYNLVDLEHTLIQSMDEAPTSVSTMLRAQANKALVSSRMVHYFSTETITKIIACLAHIHAPFVVTYFELGCKLPASLLLQPTSTWQKELAISIIGYLLTTDQIDEPSLLKKTLRSICDDRAGVEKFMMAMKAITPMEYSILKVMQSKLYWSDAIEIDRSQQIFTLTSTSKTIPKKIHSNSCLQQNTFTRDHIVRIYIPYSGLIFLWPFFSDLLNSQKLLVGNRFINKQAAHNAAYLLYYLATGSMEVAAWQLTLPKLLCGLAYDELLLPYAPVAVDKEALRPYTPVLGENLPREIKNLFQIFIQKVGNRWAILEKIKEEKDITLQLFQDYIFPQMGILIRQQGAESNADWHLTIIAQVDEGEDVSPPWHMDKVKLPWMQEEIILFSIPT